MKREDIYNLVKSAVIDGLLSVQTALDNGKFIGRYYKFPKNTTFEQSGLPHFHVCYSNDEPFDYKDIFGYGGTFGNQSNNKVDCDQLDPWRKFREFALADPPLIDCLELGDSPNDPPNIPNWKDWRQRCATYGLLARFVDRYIHVTGTMVFEENRFKPIYLEWEADLFLETLYFDIWIPIICVRFESDRMMLDAFNRIEKMPEDLQLARNAEYDATKFTLATHHTLIGAATHALVLTNWTIRNQNRAALNEIGSFASVLVQVENFFAALRVVVEAETGYSQIVVKPVGWGHGWKASLPHIYVTAVRVYPEHLENFGWLRIPPIIDANTMASVADLFKALNDLKNNGLAIAVKRLNAAQLRKDESDSILDVTIALEALLGDESKTEMTHKLAMRMAALTKIEPLAKEKPEDVFRLVKQVYKYRSSVVHGSKRKQNIERALPAKEGLDVPLVEVGLKLLRHAIRALTKQPEFLKPEKLDGYLLTHNVQKNSGLDHNLGSTVQTKVDSRFDPHT